MISEKTKQRLLNILLCVGGGALMALAYLPYDIGNLVWVGLLPLITVLWRGRMGFRRGFAYGWLYGMGWYCTSFWWIHEVGHVFFVPPAVFLLIAFLPLMAVYSLLVGLWAGIANTWLRPRLEAGPDTADFSLEKRKEAWNAWARVDLWSTVRCAIGCGALWVCIEWLRANGTLGFSWNSLGMALYDGLSMVQWAEFVGTAALSFIPVSTSVILWGAMRRTVMQFKGCGVGCRPWDFYGAVIILFALFTGGLYLSKAYAPTVLMRKDSTLQLPVMAVQQNIDQRDRIEGGALRPDLYKAYLNATMAGFREIQRDTVLRSQKNDEVGLTQQLPAWVIWPESAMGSPLHRSTTTNALIEDPYTQEFLFGDTGLPLARKQVREMGGQNFVLFGGVDECLWTPTQEGVIPSGQYNSMAIFQGDLLSAITAPKQHLMPFGEYIPLAQEIDWIGQLYTEMTGTQVGEGIRPGSGDEPIEVAVPGTDEKVGVIPAICYEDTVGRLLTKFVRKGPQVMVNISNDAWFRFSCCGEQQARNAAFRCIELRRPMVRAANMGVTCAIAPNGAFIHSLRKGDGSPHLPGYSYAVLPVDRNAGFTLYALLGDWAVVVCALLVIGLSVPAMRKKKI